MKGAADHLLMARGVEQPLSRDPGVLALDLHTIAHHLAQINRFAGAAYRPYSVAEHSLLCAELAAEAGCTPAVQLACLMHDAHEALTGDVASPVKREVGSAWMFFEASQARALRAHFGLAGTFAAAHRTVREVDLVALATERRDLLVWHAGRHRPWPELDAPGAVVAPADVHLDTAWRQHRHWSEWRDAFASRADVLFESAGLALPAQVEDV